MDMGLRYTRMLVLRNYLLMYEKGRLSENDFLSNVIHILRALKLLDIVDNDPKKAYLVSKKLVEDYFTAKNEPRILTTEIRDIINELSRHLES